MTYSASDLARTLLPLYKHGPKCMLKPLVIYFTAAVLGWAASGYSAAQTNTESDAKPARIVGTVVDINGGPVPGATVALKALDSNDVTSQSTPESGYFSFQNVHPGIRYQIDVSAKDFADWTSPAVTVEPGEYKIVGGIQLKIAVEHTEVQVHYDQAQVALEEFKAEEHQRVLGIIPNFYVAYDKNTEPLTSKMKFKLALKVSVDPVSAAGILFISGLTQASNSPKYGQGGEGYGKRVGANAADGFSDIMIGGAILPSLLHQDPRYFYQGTGSTGSRIRHAVFSPFVTRFDDGHWGPNYSSIGGDLASASLSNLYYPHVDRGPGLVFGHFAIGTAERIGATLAQEFIVARFTRRDGHVK